MGEHETVSTPSVVQRYAKGIIATGVAFLGTLGTALADGTVTPLEWVGIASATLVAAGAVVGVANASAPIEQTSAGYPDAFKTEPGDALLED
jgi:hypothetical protein